MIIYLDLVFLTDFCVNLFFLTLVDKLIADKTNLFRAVLASFAGGLFILTYLLNYYFYLLIKIIGGLIICLIAFNYQSIKKSVIKITLFYVINFCFVGIISSYKVSNIILLIVVVILTFILFILQNNRKEYYIKNINSYEVVISFPQDTLNIKGMYDSGNFTKYHSLPVIFVNNNYCKETMTSCGEVVISSACGYGVVKVYKPNFIIIDGMKKKVYVAFIAMKETDCLLNKMIK